MRSVFRNGVFCLAKLKQNLSLPVFSRMFQVSIAVAIATVTALISGSAYAAWQVSVSSTTSTLLASTSPPGASIVVPTTKSCTSSWSAPIGSHSGYIVERSLDGVSGWATAASPSPVTLSYADTTSSRAYYRVRSTLSSWVSAPTTAVQCLLNVDKISLGSSSNSTCGVTSANRAWCWGDDANGRLGLGGTTVGRTPIAQPQGNFLWDVLSQSWAHGCGVTTSSTLYCWGDTFNGKLGINNITGNRLDPVQEFSAATDWLSVSTGDQSSCALKMNRSLWCWGSAANGRLGNATSTPAVLVPQNIGVDTNWAQVSLGMAHSCAIKTTGTLWCWGAAANGRLGNGTASPDVLTPAQIGLATDWANVVAANTHTCATKSSGQLFCWGSNNSGQTGLGTAAGNTLTPSQVGTDINWMQASAGSDHTCAVKTDLSLFCWGNSSSGQLGNGTITPIVLAPERIGLDNDWIQVQAGLDSSCGLKSAGTVQCWGSGTNFANGNPNAANISSPATILVAGPASVSSASAGRTGGCAINAGALYCWGAANNGRTGIIPAQNRTAMTRVGTATDWAQVGLDSLSEAACGIRDTAGSRTLWCWGRSDNGQQGNGTTTPDVTTPTQVTPHTDWASVQMAQASACGIRDTAGSRTLWCWGQQEFGRLGNGSTTVATITSPLQVGVDSDWASFDLGAQAMCAIKTTATLWCWGRNNTGNVGNGTTLNVATPTQIGVASTWIQVAAGNAYTCGIRNAAGSRTLWCWGAATNGRLGNGTTTPNVLAPVQIGTATDWATIATGSNSTCATRTPGTLWCWGLATNGRLGNGTTTPNLSSPSQVGVDTDWASTVGGDSFNCAIKTDAGLFCFGLDSSNQLANGGTEDSDVLTPQPAQWGLDNLNIG